MEQLLSEDYQNTLTEIKEEAQIKDYDIYLTLETLKDNPYRDYNYTGLIAAYVTAKSKSDTYIGDINFFTYKMEEKEIEESIPVKSYLYKYIGDGKYVRDGFTYLTKDKTVDTYKDIGNGQYKKIGTKEIKLEHQTTKYGEVKLQAIEPKDVIELYGIEYTPEIEEEYEYRKRMIEGEVNNTGLSQSIFLTLSKPRNADTEVIIQNLLKKESLEQWRYNLVYTSTFLLGRVPYEWGGKSTKAGYDSSWFTFTEDGKQKGLDCSGFIQWVYHTAGFDENTWNKLISTRSILNNTDTISKDELEIGDLGLLNNGDTINHVGMYLGDNNWIHCSSSENTVVITKDFPFKIYKKVRKSNAESIDIIPSLEYYTIRHTFTDEDIYLASQLVANEAAGEGLNGWVAVAEVLKNRIESPDYPNSVRENIYKEAQFSDSERIQSQEPSAQLIQAVNNTLNGDLSILGNQNVMYFRNAQGSTDNWGSLPYFTTVGNHQFYTQ